MFKRSNNAVAKPLAVKQAIAEPASAGTLARKPAPTAGQQAYEARRAAKAGVSLDRWMADKQKRAQAEIEAARRAEIKANPPKPGFLKRLLDRAHKPI